MNVEECLFCNPQRTQLSFEGANLDNRVLYETEHFYVLLGLGAIVEGYVILIARDHACSMLDLSASKKQAYEREKKDLKRLIQLAYGQPVVVTEHGRVQMCVIEDSEAHDSLCYHAHQLFFPLPSNLETNLENFPFAYDSQKLHLEGPFERVFTGEALSGMDTSLLEEKEEYLLFEDMEGQVSVFKVRGKCPRQYMRYLVARALGEPGWASWAKYPFEERIIRARERYIPYLKELNKGIVVPVYAK